MRFVVDHEDVLQAHEVRHHALDHLAFGFESIQFFAVPTFEQSATAFGDLDALAQLECVIPCGI